MKNFIKFNLVLFLLLGSSVAATENITFSDIPRGHWASDPVYRAVNQLKVLRGYPDGTFRGNESVSRYDTVVYLNNLSLTMESMMDQKLKAAGVQSNSGMTEGAILDLRQEVNALRAELQAMQGREVTTADVGLPGLLKDALTIDIYNRSYKAHPDFYDKPASDSFVPRVTFRLGREFGLNGYEFDIYEGAASAAGWAGRYFTPDIWLKIRGSLGPGQYISSLDNRVNDKPGNTLGMTLSLWGLELGVDHTDRGEMEVDYYALESEELLETRKINRTVGMTKYKLPVALPFFNTTTLEYAVDNYYTVRDEYREQELRTTRYRTGVRFDITDMVTLRTNALKEYQYYYEDVDGEPRNTERPAQYYDIVFETGDVFNHGTTFKAMYAYKDSYFGENNLGEDVAGVNLLGYSTGQYMWGTHSSGRELMPSANTLYETGLKVTQVLWHPDFSVEAIYMYGRANPDKKIAPDEDTYYIYEQQGFGLNWRVQKNGVLYLAHEQTDLFDSSIDNEQRQFFEVINRVGVKLTF